MFTESSTAGPSPSPSPPPPSFSSSHSRSLARSVQFVSAYYKVLASAPDELYTFYDDDSVVVRIEEEEQGTITDHEQHVGQLAIHNLITALGYSRCKVKVESLDAVDSVQDSLIVLVTGIIALQGHAPKSFIQSFLLVQAQQETADEPLRYYIRNDIQRYLEYIPTPPTHQPSSTPTTAPAPAPTPVPAPSSTATPAVASDTLMPPSSPSVRAPVTAEVKATSAVVTQPSTPHAATAPDDIPLEVGTTPAGTPRRGERKVGGGAPPGLESQLTAPAASASTEAGSALPPPSPPRATAPAPASPAASKPATAPPQPTAAPPVSSVPAVSSTTDETPAPTAAPASAPAAPTTATAGAPVGGASQPSKSSAYPRRNGSGAGRGRGGQGQGAQATSATTAAAPTSAPVQPAAPTSWASRVQFSMKPNTAGPVAPATAAPANASAEKPKAPAAPAASTPAKASVPSPSAGPTADGVKDAVLPPSTAEDGAVTPPDGDGDFRPVGGRGQKGRQQQGPQQPRQGSAEGGRGGGRGGFQGRPQFQQRPNGGVGNGPTQPRPPQGGGQGQGGPSRGGYQKRGASSPSGTPAPAPLKPEAAAS